MTEMSTNKESKFSTIYNKFDL